MIAIVDYGIGNIKSVVKAFNYLGVRAELTGDPSLIAGAQGVVLPGVGAFGEGMNNLKNRELISPLKQVIDQGRPFLGICLGLQLLFSGSEEDPDIPGLDLIEGRVKRFDPHEVKKIPHMGWNQINLTADHPLFQGNPDQGNYYFVHSYYVEPIEEGVILGQTNYADRLFTSVVARDNIWGIQAHPEKSSSLGLNLLRNFSEVVASAGNTGN